jgi:hypothetical protein
MKKIFTLAVLLAGVALNSQYYYNDYSTALMNPGNLNNDSEYPSGGGLDPAWVQICGSGASPIWSTNQTIPFTFSFNGSPETQYKVSNSGCVTFDVASAVAAPAFASVSLPSATIPDKSVVISGLSGTGANDFVMMKNFGTAPNRQHWIFFTSYTAGSGYTYWSIVLEETTNKIYVVDQRTSVPITTLAIGIQTNSTTAYALNGGSNNVASVAGASALTDDNGYYEFNPGTRPVADMAAISEPNNAYEILSAAPFSLQTYFRSFGSATVTSYDMNYSVNGGPTVTGSISSVSVATQAGTTGTHPTPWTPTATGIYNIQMWATNINGNADANNSNDTLDFQITVVDTLAPRVTLMEVFTSATCVPCVAGNQNMDNNVVPNLTAGEYTIIKYQQDFPGSGDPYANSESVNRRAYYGINSIPRMEIDGQWDLNASSLTVPIFDSYQQQPSFMEIGISSAYYSGTNVSVVATINPLITYAGSGWKYHVVVIENQTTGNVASNGETSFNDVMMNMHPTETGTNISALTANTPININVTVPMSGTNVEQMSDLKVVIFVQDNTTKEVLQSQWLDVVPNGVSDIDASGNGIVNMYPNPATDNVTVQYQVGKSQEVSWTMTNALGEVVNSGSNVAANQGANQMNINTAGFATGVYFMTLTTSEGQFTQRVVIAE